MKMKTPEIITEEKVQEAIEKATKKWKKKQ